MANNKSETPAALVAKLKDDLEALSIKAREANLSSIARRNLDNGMREIMEVLRDLLRDLDPIRQPEAVFDPSNPKVVGRFVSLALVAQKRYPLADVDRFYGSGVYAIYYKGDFAPYAPLSGTETPIYVGQAAPGLSNAREPIDQGEKLAKRLSEHRKNIQKATSTLDINDFEYRALVVQSGWETAAEDYLIHLFKPIWNSETKILYGLGKHGDDAKTRQNKRSPWDTLHPGRGWAAKSAEDARTEPQIREDLDTHFNATKIYSELDDVLHDFVLELRQA